MRKHLVLWDYQVGYVRITAFFKALDYTKVSQLLQQHHRRCLLLTLARQLQILLSNATQVLTN